MGARRIFFRGGGQIQGFKKSWRPFSVTTNAQTLCNISRGNFCPQNIFFRRGRLCHGTLALWPVQACYDNAALDSAAQTLQLHTAWFDSAFHRSLCFRFRFQLSCSVSKGERLKVEWVRKLRPNFELFDPLKISGRMAGWDYCMK